MGGVGRFGGAVITGRGVGTHYLHQPGEDIKN